jgi:hypothetical protein
MKLWKKLSKYLKGHEKWIEIKLPEYFKRNNKDDLLKDKEEMLDDEDKVLQELELEREEE